MAKDINSATQQDLEEVPQMSAARAETIIHYRDAHGDFTDMKQLTDVPGIGETMAEQMAEYFTIGRGTTADENDDRTESSARHHSDEADDEGEPKQPRRTRSSSQEGTHRSSGQGGTNAEGQRLNKDGSVDKRQFNRAPSEEGFPENAADEDEQPQRGHA